jgi:Zinc dependent phospholipase C
MPGIATHITIVQRLAVSQPELTRLLGDPNADPSTPEGRKIRFANLGAVGPDLFYAMLDYGDELQGMENFIVKVGGTFQCISELMEKINRFVLGVAEDFIPALQPIEETLGLISSVVRESLLALVIDAGFNFWPTFQAQRQQDEPRKKWFWSDYGHYIRTGQLVSHLLREATQTGNPNLRAYALGYLCHYVTDTIGHGYVNQVVQAPYRLYWQRHHLVETFIDAYEWDRWHIAQPAPQPPTTEEQPLDRVTTTPNQRGTGAPLSFARLHDHIFIGDSTLGDPVDDIVEKVCKEIESGLFQLGIAENTDQPAPDDQEFRAWTDLMVRALHDTYDTDSLRPHRLGGDGFPTADDIAGAYGVLRLYFKVSTEDKIEVPKFPDISTDISEALKKFLNDLENNLKRLRPPSLPSFDGSFSWDALWDAIVDAVEYAANFLDDLAKTVFDAIRDLIRTGVTVINDAIKVFLYLLNSGLYSVYRQLRLVLVLNAYTAPLAEELEINFGGPPFNTSFLWQSVGNLPPGQYPVEQILAEEDRTRSTYRPFQPPKSATGRVEQPSTPVPAPFVPPEFGRLFPDAFTDAPLGRDDMFQASGPEPATTVSGLSSFASEPRDFGGVMANCAEAIRRAEHGNPDLVLPDYNMDCDRGWAWPTWDVNPMPTSENPQPGNVPDPLNPKDLPAQQNEARVNAVSAPN